MDRPVLILGSGGMLGRAFRELLTSAGVEHRCLGRADLDLARPDSIQRGITERWSLVVNCAAWTDVDGAEANEAAATAVNGSGVGHLAAACLRSGSPLLHFSTDYVFSGRSADPYRVDQARQPLNAYGRSKAVGEELIQAAVDQGLRALVVRTSWLYAPWGKNFVRTIAKAAREKPSLRVVNDQRGTPTSSQHLAKGSFQLACQGLWGTAHVTDGGQCTWYDLASAIAASVSPACRVEPCTTAEFPRPATRPSYSVLDVSTTEAALGPLPGWRACLAPVLSSLEDEYGASSARK